MIHKNVGCHEHLTWYFEVSYWSPGNSAHAEQMEQRTSPKISLNQYNCQVININLSFTV